MKKNYLLLLVSLLSAMGFAQETEEEKQWTAIFQKADPSELMAFIKQFDLNNSKTAAIQGRIDEKNDTVLAVSGVMRTILRSYQADQLEGVNRYRDYTRWPRVIIIQPEVEACLVPTPEIDYRGIFSGKYTYYDIMTYNEWADRRMTGSRLDIFHPAYSDIPDVIDCKKYRYQIHDPQFVAMDTLTQMRLENYFLERVDSLDSKKIRVVIPCGFGRRGRGRDKGKAFSFFTYSIWVEKIIFNPALDQCIVHTSASSSVYEIFLLKIKDEWIIAHCVERMHFD